MLKEVLCATACAAILGGLLVFHAAFTRREGTFIEMHDRHAEDAVIITRFAAPH